MKGLALTMAMLLLPTPGQAEGYEAEATVGWGYFEMLHVGTAVHLGERSTVGALVGSNLGTNGKSDWTAGLSYAHALGQPYRDLQFGWKVEALYWSQSDPDYDWRLLSLLFGMTMLRPVTDQLSIGLDLGLAYTYTVASDRKQNVDFSSPQKWNGNICVELRYRFASW